MALKTLGERTFIALPAGCMSAVGFNFPQLCFANNAIISTFAGTGSILTGMAAGAKALGVVDVTTEKGQYTPVAVLGTLLVEAGGTIAIGDAIASDGEGRAVKVADSAIANGYAKDAGTEGQEIRIVRGI